MSKRLHRAHLQKGAHIGLCRAPRRWRSQVLVPVRCKQAPYVHCMLELVRCMGLTSRLSLDLALRCIHLECINSLQPELGVSCTDILISSKFIVAQSRGQHTQWGLAVAQQTAKAEMRKQANLTGAMCLQHQVRMACLIECTCVSSVASSQQPTAAQKLCWD